jgi:hypothetical protein
MGFIYFLGMRRKFGNFNTDIVFLSSVKNLVLFLREYDMKREKVKKI